MAAATGVDHVDDVSPGALRGVGELLVGVWLEKTQRRVPGTRRGPKSAAFSIIEIVAGSIKLVGRNGGSQDRKDATR